MEEKRTNNTKKGILIGCGITALLLTGFLGSYAYFMGNLGSNKNEEVSTQAGILALTFADGNNGITEALEFGGSVEKTFSIQNTGTLDATTRIMWDDLVNTYLDGSLTYTLSSSDTETGTYTNIVENQNVPVTSTSSKELLAGNLTIPTGTTKYYKLIITLNYLDDVDQTADLKANLSTHFSIEESDGKDLNLTIKQTLKKLNKTVKEERPNFAETATTDETSDGLYQMADDYGTSYYYRGAVEDNYVKFGTWANITDNGDKAGKPMYWRIIRVNGDGSVRMIYDGTSVHTNGENSIDRVAVNDIAWNVTNDNDAKYVGYMYGGANGTESLEKIDLGEIQYENSTNAIYNETDSNIKTVIENWYKKNLKNKDSIISDAIYCNDRTSPGAKITGWNLDTGLGYGRKITAYGAVERLVDATDQWTFKTNASPQLKCLQKNDAFTKEKSNRGNGKLKEKVGLITADEISVAGGLYSSNIKNTNFYLTKGINYWTLSPRNFNNLQAWQLILSTNGYLTNSNVKYEASVAPVISLAPEYFNTLIGDGTMDNPFREKGMES